MAQHTIGHLCPSCVNGVFWSHRKALEKVLDIANADYRAGGAYTEDTAKKMADAAFECLSFFDLYYDGCYELQTGTRKESEVWLPSVQAVEDERSEGCGNDPRADGNPT